MAEVKAEARGFCGKAEVRLSVSRAYGDYKDLSTLFFFIFPAAI